MDSLARKIGILLGSGSGSGDGPGSGSGDGSGNGSGYGSGSGYGYGSGSGYGITSFNGESVHYIDGVPTIIRSVPSLVDCGDVHHGDGAPKGDFTHFN